MKVLTVEKLDFYWLKIIIIIKTTWDYWFIIMANPSQTEP